MARKSDEGSHLAQQLFAAFLKLPWKVKAAIVALLLVAGVVVYFANRPKPTPAPAPGDGGTVVFCFWNMENLFDDKDDKRGSVDEEYDTWFVETPEDRRAKYEKLAGWLVRQNGGNGPDIIAAVEIESVRRRSCCGTR